MRLMEVGTKELGKGNKKQARELFSKAYDLYSLFWGVNLKMIDPAQVENLGRNRKYPLPESQSGNFPEYPGSLDKTAIRNIKKNSLLVKLNKLVQKVVDCCKE